MKTILPHQCREVLDYCFAWNCENKQTKKTAILALCFYKAELVQLDGTISKLKENDFILINENAEMSVISEQEFNKDWKELSRWRIKQYATSAEDYHFGLGLWKDSPLNDVAINNLRK